MKRILINYLFALFLVFPVSAQYVHDNLGNQYQKRTIEMGDDYEGRVICTLVRKPLAEPVRQYPVYSWVQRLFLSIGTGR